MNKNNTPFRTPTETPNNYTQRNKIQRKKNKFLSMESDNQIKSTDRILLTSK